MMGPRPDIITTVRLEMRPIREKDYPELIALMKDDAVGVTYMVPDDPDEKFCARIKALSERTDRFVYGVYLDDVLIGLFNDTGIDGDELEVGYALRGYAQGKGYGTEMLGGAIKALFGMGFKTVRAGHFEGNEASRRIMEKNGMLPEEHTDTIVYRGTEHRCLYRAITYDGK